VDKLRPGLSVPQIASFLAVGSRAVRKCPDVGPNIQFWVNLCGSFEQAIVFIKRSNSLLMSDLDRVIKPNLTFLHQYGISVQDIAHLCSRNPQMLTISLERLKEVMQCVEEFGVPPSSGMFNHVVAAVSCNTKEKHIARLEFLKSALGCSRSHVATAVSKAPTIITMSEENLLRKIQFLTNAVGFELHYILQRPVLLLHSLEKRLVPRVFLPTVAFLPLGSGNGWYRGIPLNTARIQISNQNRFKPLVQTVWRGIPRYKLFIPRYKLFIPLQIKRPPGFE
jgi:mTERF domain-containing protein